MSKVIIELEARDWKKFRGQNIIGEIVKRNGLYKAEVEIPQLPGESVDYDVVSPIELNDELIGKTVVGDIDGDFHIRIICFLKPSSID